MHCYHQTQSEMPFFRNPNAIILIESLCQTEIIYEVNGEQTVNSCQEEAQSNCDTPPHASHAPCARKCYKTAICKRFPGFSLPCSSECTRTRFSGRHRGQGSQPAGVGVATVAVDLQPQGRQLAQVSKKSVDNCGGLRKRTCALLLSWFPCPGNPGDPRSNGDPKTPHSSCGNATTRHAVILGGARNVLVTPKDMQPSCKWKNVAQLLHFYQLIKVGTKGKLM